MKSFKFMLFFISLCAQAEIPHHWGVATVMGAKRRIQNNPILHGANYDMPSPYFKAGSVPIYISRSSLELAPLVILFPGIFGTADDRLSSDTVDLLQKRNVHIISIPNFFNQIYVRRVPLYDSGEPSRIDLKIAFDAIDWAVKKIGQKNISTTHLIGESLGTFMASGVYALDAELPKPRINGSILLMFPPMDLHYTIQNFDKIIHEFEKPFKECSRLSWLFEFITTSDSEASYSKSFDECTSAFMLHTGFVGTIAKVVDEFNSELSQKTQELDFTNFLKAYNPKLLSTVEAHHPDVVLATWLDQGILKNPRPLKIITAKDDFLNWGRDWDQWIKERHYSKLDVHIFPYGGHCGPLGYQEGKDVIIDFAKRSGW